MAVDGRVTHTTARGEGEEGGGEKAVGGAAGSSNNGMDKPPTPHTTLPPTHFAAHHALTPLPACYIHHHHLPTCLPHFCTTHTAKPATPRQREEKGMLGRWLIYQQAQSCWLPGHLSRPKTWQFSTPPGTPGTPDPQLSGHTGETSGIWKGCHHCSQPSWTKVVRTLLGKPALLPTDLEVWITPTLVPSAVSGLGSGGGEED